MLKIDKIDFNYCFRYLSENNSPQGLQWNVGPLYLGPIFNIKKGDSIIHLERASLLQASERGIGSIL